MLRTLFPKYFPGYERSCCAGEMSKFAPWLLDTGYSPKNTRGHLRRFRKIFEKANCSATGDIFTEEQLATLFSPEAGTSWRALSYSSTRRVYERFLLSENRLIQKKRPSSLRFASLDDYEQYLEDVRGFTGPTVSQHRATVSEFLVQSLQPSQSIADLTNGHVDRYIATKRCPYGWHV